MFSRAISSISANITKASFRKTNWMVAARNSSGHVDENPGLANPKHGRDETDEEFDERYVKYLSRPEIDGWEIRKAMGNLHGMDLIPEPKIIIAALQACRRVNDYSLGIRILEAVKCKCADKTEIWPYIVQEIRPTLDELGLNTPEELGYDKPELSMPNTYEM